MLWFPNSLGGVIPNVIQLIAEYQRHAEAFFSITDEILEIREEQVSRGIKNNYICSVI